MTTTTKTTGIRPLEDRVLIQPIETEKKTTGGIVLPDTAKEKPMQGKVIAVGPGRLNKKGDRLPLSVKVGQTVLFGKFAGNEIKIDGKPHSIMRESEILAILEDN